MPRKVSGESYVWTDAKEKLFLEKLDEYLAERGGKQPTSSVLELWATEFNTRFGGVPAFGSTLSQKKRANEKDLQGLEDSANPHRSWIRSGDGYGCLLGRNMAQLRQSNPNFLVNSIIS